MLDSTKFGLNTSILCKDNGVKRAAFTVINCQPLHLGHTRMINRMIENYRYAIIGLSSNNPEPSGKALWNDSQRIAMLKNVYGSRIKIVLINQQKMDNPDEWVDHCLETITHAGHPTPTDYISGSERHARSYTGRFWDKMVSDPYLDEDDAKEKYFVNINNTMVLRILSKDDRYLQAVPIASEIRNLVKRRNYSWCAWVPRVNYALVEQYARS